MTIDEAKRELKNYILDGMSFMDETEESRRLRAKAEGVTACYAEHVGARTGKSKIEEYAVLLMANAEHMTNELKKEEQRLHDVRTSIHKIPNPYRQILIERHIKGKSLKDVAIKYDKNCSELSRRYKIGVQMYCEIRNRAIS